MCSYNVLTSPNTEPVASLYQHGSLNGTFWKINQSYHYEYLDFIKNLSIIIDASAIVAIANNSKKVNNLNRLF